MFDYKQLIPSSDENFIYINRLEFPIDCVDKIVFDYNWDKATYWFRVKIKQDDKHRLTVFVKSAEKGLKNVLLLGENRYEIHGKIEIVDKQSIKWEECYEFQIVYIVDEAKKVVNFPRKELQVTREELIDLED